MVTPSRNSSNLSYQSCSPRYEELWKEFIWDVTDRDFLGGQGNVRHEVPIHLRRFASAHDTFLRSLMFAEALSRVSYLGDGHALEPFFVNERPLNFYVHLGRFRDLLCLMVEEFETEGTGKKPSFRGKGRDWDYKKVGQHLDGLMGATGGAFHTWQDEVGKYRNFIHKTAHAVAINSKGQWLLLKSNFVNEVRDWTEVNIRPTSDFVELQAQMDRHLNDLAGVATVIWNHFLAEVRKWKVDQKAYRKRLALPGPEYDPYNFAPADRQPAGPAAELSTLCGRKNPSSDSNG
jgi:hypothetical protein